MGIVPDGVLLLRPGKSELPEPLVLRILGARQGEISTEPTEPENPNDDQSTETATQVTDALKAVFGDARRLSLQAMGLPLTLVLKSEVETTSIHVDRAGNVSLSRGAMPDPNVIIEGSHATLCALLQTKEPILMAPGPLTITFNSGDVKGLVVEVAEGDVIGNPLADLLGL
jgi:hypothetical protein